MTTDATAGMTVSAILLAAGRATRFAGGQKLQAMVGNRPLVAHVADALDCPEISERIVVTAPGSALAGQLPDGGGWRVVENDRAEAVLSDSIRTGLRARRLASAGVLLALGDTPALRRDDVRKLCQHFMARGGDAIVIPKTADGRPAHPIIWPSRFIGQLEALSGDSGGRYILQGAKDQIDVCDTGNPDIAVDIDTMDDLATWRGAFRAENAVD